ncbi:O-antigen ligase family protein, partial [Ralstonia pseudosolanacearum]
LRWADGSFAAGALAALGVGLWAARDWGEGRMGSAFLNPIHFGDIALILGVLSALSINWWRKDPLAVRLLKVGGLLAGLVASLLTGSRGGWVALPFILLLVAVARGRDKPARWRVLVPAVAVLGVAVLYAVSGTIHERIHMVWVDLAQYAQGQKDTSIGIRLQIYQAALMLIPKHPIFGLGPGGFADSLQALVDAGRMSATAAQLGRGEAHNQLLAYTANFGLVGGLSIVAIHLVPGLLCWRCLKATAAPMRRAALMGAVFALAFFVFGLTVEIFTLKMTASFYAAVIASLAGIASHTGPASEAGTSSPTER